MKYLVRIIILLILIPNLLKAQGDYKPGYIVNLKNETIKGFIYYKDWNNNPKNLILKPLLTQPLKNLTLPM